MIRKSLLPLAFVCLCAALSQASLPWNLHGTVIGKSFRPLPHSLGESGIYKLEVRDEANKVRRQMVSREIFDAYQIGDSFDSNSPLIQRQKPDRDLPKVIAPNTVAPRTKSASSVSVRSVAMASVRRPSPALAVTDSHHRLASAGFTPDMLPETEGF